MGADISALGIIDSSTKIVPEPMSPIKQRSVVEPRHIFHYECMMHWVKNAHICPLCKKDVLDKTE